MKKQLIALALILVLAAVFIACGRSADTSDYVEPAMEGIIFAAFDAETFADAVVKLDGDVDVPAHEEAASFSAGETTMAMTTAVSSQAAATTQTALLSSNKSAASTAAKPVAMSAAITQRTTTTTRYVSPQTAAPATTATTTARTTTTTTTTRLTTTTTAAPQPKPDYETMGQAKYQEEAIKALNALRAGQGNPPMTANSALMAAALTQAQLMAAAGRSFHSDNPPGCESVCYVPYFWPANVLGENLANHVSQFITDGHRVNVGIAVVRNGNSLYAVMIGN